MSLSARRRLQSSKAVSLIVGLSICNALTSSAVVYAQNGKVSPEPKLRDLTIEQMSAEAAPQATPAISNASKIYKEWSISANKVEVSEDNSRVTAHGAVRVAVKDQNSILFADDVVYDGNTGMVEAVGHVAIVRNNERNVGARFRFKINSDEYLLTQSDVYVGKPKTVSRLSSSTGSIKLPSDRSAIERLLDDDDDSTGSDLDDLKNLFTGKVRHTNTDSQK